ncbi:MAG: hypothetical protein IKV61_04765 [Clostridia bacterium]|nr:hypothetical protein [Clostridia bacterium]
MICKNIEIHNAGDLIYNEDGSVSWRRVPTEVFNEMEMRNAPNTVHGVSGVELRFVIKGESVKIKMSQVSENPASMTTMHVFRGGIQSGWEDHEVNRIVTGEVKEFEFKRAENIERLNDMSKKAGYDWDSEVVRVILYGGRIKLYDVIGDVEPPKKSQTPSKTMLCYGSSITNMSNSLDASNAWVAKVAHNLNVDFINKGMAGSCAMEPAMANYIASEGEKGNWDFATLELGINVLGWEVEKFRERADNIIYQVATRNQDKQIFVISPFYHCGDEYWDDDNAKIYRVVLKEIVEKYNFKNVTYVNGFEILDKSLYMSGDFIHPNIYGVQKIAQDMTKIISEKLNLKVIK